jgi:DNA-binding beta-propeller fold protein YncE
VEVRLTTGRGPQGVAIDEKNGLAYVAHFTDSYVGVVDLDKRHATYGKVLLNVGQPKPPRAEQ